MSDEAAPETSPAASLIDLTSEAATAEALRTSEAQRDEHLRELTAINARLEQAVAINEHVLAMATHDMRSPITSILGFVSVLRSSGHDEETKGVAIDAIERQTRRLAHLVDDLLSLTLIDGGNIVLATRSVALAPLARQIAADTPGAEDVSIDIDDDVLVFADPVRVGQIIGNLLTNAVKYGEDPIEISASGDEWVELRVRDHGRGVPRDHVAELFERFSSASRKSARDGRGTGLGLAIVRGLTEVQGGRVSYESGVPHGACFVVRLPGRARRAPTS